MFRIILTLGFTLVFAFAQHCNFNDEKQDECEIDIKNPPLMLHKFINGDGSEFSEYRACMNEGDIEIDDVRYEVLDCSMIESKNGNLTEGVTINNGKNLITNRLVTIKQDNVLLRVAGDFVLDSGIRFNIKNPKNFIVEMIEGTNTKSNIILQRGSSLKANALIVPEGKNSSIYLNTFYGGIYEKEFIDLINQSSPKSRGGMETLLNVEDVFALSQDGSNIASFNGNVFCGPEVNPLDLNNTNYPLKRLFRVKNTSIDKPSDNNAICEISEGECFENLLNFGNRKIDGKSYKIATANANIIPTYDIFIESGKIISSDNRGIKDIMPDAKIYEQHYGKCNQPTKIAFDKSIVEKYLASLEAKKATQELAIKTQETSDFAESSPKDSTAKAEAKEALKLAESIKTNEAKSDEEIVEEIIEEKTQEIAESQTIDTTSQDSTKSTPIAESTQAKSTPKETPENIAITSPSETTTAQTSDSAKKDIEIATNEAKSDEEESIDSPISAELNAELNENLQDLLSTFSAEKLAESSKNSTQDKAETTTQESPQSTIDSTDSKAIDNIKGALAKKELKIDDDFLIVEKDAYEKFNKECYGDLQCLYDSLLPYDKVAWTKKSSKNITNAMYVLNFTNDNLAVNCEVKNYYGKNIKKSFKLSPTNTIGVLDMKFATSSDRTQIICKTNKMAKATNKIIVTPASFDIKYNFTDDSNQETLTLKAGTLKIAFKQGTALTLEGDIDSGFNGSLKASDVRFTQKNKCDGSVSKNVSLPKDLMLNFKKGYLRNASMDVKANIVAFGALNIDFAIANNDKTCSNAKDALMPNCTQANISKEISIIPANFRIKTDILSQSNKVSYYGQIDDKYTFKYNPLLSVEVEALDSNSKPININKDCNYGSIELSLKSDKLIEFKRTSSDRINSKIIVYLRDFQKPTGTSIKAYFGINKLMDKYKNFRKIAQNDLLEPVEVTLFDFLFSVRFKNGKSQFYYENPEVYDRLDDKSNPIGVLIARGKLQTNNIKGDTQDSASLIAKYAIYCKDCDRKLLMKYLQSEPEVESQYWYINNQHPSSFYIANDFINVGTSSKNVVKIINSNTAFEGRQQISFGSDNAGIYNISIAQRSAEFAPYLNYSDKYKNSYVSNAFNVMISESAKDIFKDIEEIKKVEEATPEVKEVKTAESKPSKPTPKPTVKPKQKPSKPKSSGNIKLDIEE